ncbi:hypothetical protein A7981_04755 [Methylovorus sp. MM2]|uniref:surface lipoprotein assembly modifier n=1 Tax=Methylovorus sp. MM2 TaxID=1848038 RepID=UPI0007E17F34|nr:surface lipoprotein assembly modifier [Methylovorus sp. MM2]OAM52762.1 hypothetical protein A7981_04755 [Methylovorus sp. MM2]
MPMLAHAADESLEKAAALIKANKYSAAYDLLEPLEADRAGDPSFDYLFGVAALQNGKATRAVFALERVLAIQPNNTDARAFIARAYFQLGEKDTAKTEFKYTLEQKPSPALSKAINDYMTAIDKSLGLITTYNAYIEATYGYDTNINSATGVNGFPLLGGTVILDKNAREISDNFMSANAGASFRTPIAKDIDFFAGVNGMMRVNLHEELFDTKSYDANAGLRIKQAIDTYTVALQDSNFYVDSVRYRHAYGVTGQWQRDLSATDQVNAFAQFTKIKYPDNDIRDAKRYVAGGGWAHVFSGDKTPVLFLSGYLGKEKPEDSSFDQFDNNIYGARAGGQVTLTPHWVTFANSSYEYRDYKGDEPFFSKAREDKQYDASVGLRYLGKIWTIKPQISYLKNDSNIVVNDFDRTLLSVSFRHDFNW